MAELGIFREGNRSRSDKVGSTGQHVQTLQDEFGGIQLSEQCANAALHNPVQASRCWLLPHNAVDQFDVIPGVFDGFRVDHVRVHFGDRD